MSQIEPTAKIACSVKHASEITDLGKTTIYALMAEGKIESVLVGRKRLILVDSLRRLLEAA